MQAAVDYFENSTAGLQIGRAHPNLLNGIKVEYYGSLTALNQLAQISIGPRLLIIQPYDTQILVSIDKAIKQSALNLNPQKVGQTLHLNIPSLSEERQQAVAKHASQLAEAQKVAIRNIRREARSQAKILAIPEKTVEKLTSEFISKIDQLLEVKIQEIRGEHKRWKI